MITENISENIDKKEGDWRIINLNQNPESEEFENIKARLIADFTFSYFTLTAFFIATFILKYLLQISLYTEILFLIFGWAAYSYLAQYFIKKSEINLKTLKSFDFIHYIIGLSFMTAIFYYIGGALWIEAIFYVFIILNASFLSNPRVRTKNSYILKT